MGNLSSQSSVQNNDDVDELALNKKIVEDLRAVRSQLKGAEGCVEWICSICKMHYNIVVLAVFTNPVATKQSLNAQVMESQHSTLV
jgi:hypothetical protein